MNRHTFSIAAVTLLLIMTPRSALVAQQAPRGDVTVRPSVATPDSVARNREVMLGKCLTPNAVLDPLARHADADELAAPSGAPAIARRGFVMLEPNDRRAIGSDPNQRATRVMGGGLVQRRQTPTNLDGYVTVTGECRVNR